MAAITSLFMKKQQDIILLIITQFMKNSMSCVRSEILQDFTDCSGYGLQEEVQMGRHHYESKQAYSFCFL